jgi:hypothetical protein
VVSLRRADGGEASFPLRQVQGRQVVAAVPWRKTRSSRGQAHYPGYFWSATIGGHAGYRRPGLLPEKLLEDVLAAVRPGDTIGSVISRMSRTRRPGEVKAAVLSLLSSRRFPSLVLRQHGQSLQHRCRGLFRRLMQLVEQQLADHMQASHQVRQAVRVLRSERDCRPRFQFG